MKESNKTWQKRSKSTRKQNEIARKREIEVMYGYPFETVREVFSYAFCYESGSSASLEVMKHSADSITRSEFKKAYNRWMRRDLRKKHSLIAWVGGSEDPSCADEDNVLA